MTSTPEKNSETDAASRLDEGVTVEGAPGDDIALENAAQEWREDPVPRHRTKRVRSAEKPSKETGSAAGKASRARAPGDDDTEATDASGPTTLVLDPYGFRSEEILAAQADADFELGEFELGEEDAFATAIHEPAATGDPAALPSAIPSSATVASELAEDIVGYPREGDASAADETNAEARDLERSERDADLAAGAEIEDGPLDVGALRRRIEAESLARELDAELADDESFASTPENEADAERVLGNLAESMRAEESLYARELEAAAAEASAEDVERARDESREKIAEDEALEAARQNADDDADADEIDPELRAALPKNPQARFNAPELAGAAPHPERTAIEEDARAREAGPGASDSELADLESAIEALLFMSEKPLGAVKLQELLGPEISFHYFQEALTNLRDRYRRAHHGFELAEVAGGFQFRTKPLRAALAKKLARIQFQRLSSGAMETLAILAYRQPALKETVDEVRGVDSSHFIRTLLDRKLIRITGRSELPGRPMLYETTDEFLQVFGLRDLGQLPPLAEIEGMVPASQSDHDEDPRIKQMRKLVADMKADASVSLLYDPKEDEEFLKEIRERVKSIDVSTPTLEAEDAARREAADAAKAAEALAGAPPPGAATGEQLPLG